MEKPNLVMIIDDEESLRSTLTRILRAAGINSNAASDGRQAIKLLNDEYNLVFLDIHLPQMDGIETLRGNSSQIPKIARDHVNRSWVAPVGGRFHATGRDRLSLETG